MKIITEKFSQKVNIERSVPSVVVLQAINVLAPDLELPKKETIYGIITGISSFRKAGNLTHSFQGVRYQGSQVKRLAKLLLKNGYKTTKEGMGKAGQILGNDEEQEMHIEIAKYSDWKHGSFESSVTKDIGSCWWGKHTPTRLGLVQDPCGYSVLLYESAEKMEKESQLKGIGRCWMYHDDKGIVIFNAYGKYSLSQIAQALMLHYGLDVMCKIRLYSPTAFINAGVMNNEGRDGGHTGVGYWIGKETIEVFKLPDLRTKINCKRCSKEVADEDAAKLKDGAYCMECYHRSVSCRHCGDRHWNNSKYCNVCIEQHTMTCPVHGKIVSPSKFKVWHGDIHCEQCFRAEIVVTCSVCKRTHLVGNTSTILRKRFGNKVCKNCANKLAKDITNEKN